MSLLELEKTPQSPHSPGIVQNQEILARLGFHPEHIVNGKIIPTAITRDDLAERGFSVDREAYLNAEIVIGRANQQMENTPEKRQSAIISAMLTQGIRNEIAPEGNRAFVVLDRMKDGSNPAHACILSAYARSPSALKKLKDLLLPHLQNYVAIADYLAKLKEI